MICQMSQKATMMRCLQMTSGMQPGAETPLTTGPPSKPVSLSSVVMRNIFRDGGIGAAACVCACLTWDRGPVSLSRYGAAFRPTAVNASKIVRILDQLRVELQRSVRGLHAQGHRAHDARNGGLQNQVAAVLIEGGLAQVALLHQPAEAAATCCHHSRSAMPSCGSL